MARTANRGPGRPPAAKSAQTRGRILEAAREVFGEVGYDAATFQEIAARAELTRPAINHHFPTKQVLYQQVVEQTNAALISAGLERAEREATFTGRVSAFLEAAARARGEDETAAAFLVTSVLESQRHPELSRQDSVSLQETREFATSAVADGIAAGELRPDLDSDAAVELLMAAFWGLGFYAGFVGDQAQLNSVAGEFVGLLGDGTWLRDG